jgi:hypothetical protein
VSGHKNERWISSIKRVIKRSEKMLKQTLVKRKKVLAVLLSVFFLATLTVASASACGDNGYTDHNGYYDHGQLGWFGNTYDHVHNYVFGHNYEHKDKDYRRDFR